MELQLEQELRTYERELPGLLAHEGKFVLIKGDQVVGVFETWEAGVRAGRQRFGNVPIFVNEISREQEVVDILSPLE